MRPHGRVPTVATVLLGQPGRGEGAWGRHFFSPRWEEAYGRDGAGDTARDVAFVALLTSRPAQAEHGVFEEIKIQPQDPTCLPSLTHTGGLAVPLGSLLAPGPVHLLPAPPRVSHFLTRPYPQQPSQRYPAPGAASDPPPPQGLLQV